MVDERGEALSGEVERATEQRDPFSAMTPRFNWFFRRFARRFFGEITLDEVTVERLRELEARGSIIYVMRYASRLDYFLFNALFARHDLRLSSFANGIHFDYYRPLWETLRIRLLRLRDRLRRRPLAPARERVAALVRGGRSLFLFLRTERLRTRLRGRRHVANAKRVEDELLDAAVSAPWDGASPVFVVPLALFWRKGPRSERRFLNLTYGAPNRPSDVAKVSWFLANYHNLAVKVGEPIDLGAFMAERRAEGRESLVRKVRRSIMVFLYREEKVVEGPTLRPRHKVQELVLSTPGVARAVELRAERRRRGIGSAWRDAERMFGEIAAHMNSTFLALINAVVTPLFRRLFVSIEVTGLEAVAEYARSHPIVLVPSHRSYFDFLLLSWLFYANHLVPPHIAARENMAFGPFGFVFRRAGAFFLRRSFDDPLYKEVFRAYVAYLVREGFTQEFFIEGGRSRTGRSLAPKLGMLSWDVEGFLSTSRRDLFFVPIAITYERLVEEGAIVSELSGDAKQAESMSGLMRARKVLRDRWGSAHVSCGQPISMAEAMGGRRARFAAERTPADVAEKRSFIAAFGNRILERINDATVANATAVVSSAFLGAGRRGLLRHELVQRMSELVELMRLEGVRLTPALERDEGDFEESIGFLLRAGLVESRPDPRGEILYFEEGKRPALDLYRNALLHRLAPASFLARRLLEGAAHVDELREDLEFWTDLYYHEFFTPRGTALDVRFDRLLGHFERLETVERHDEVFHATEKGRVYLAGLARQTRGLIEAYGAAFSAVLEDEELGTPKQLGKRAEEAFRRSELLGEAHRFEASSAATYANAFDALSRRGILERARREGSKESVFVRGPDFDALAGLCERLAAVLAAG